MSWGYSFYFTSNQDSTERELGIEDPYETIWSYGQRLKAALGPDVLDRNVQCGGEFRPPTYRSACEALERCPWEAHGRTGHSLFVIPYNTLYNGWLKSPESHRSGFMAGTCNPYEFAYEQWEAFGDKYHPDLFLNGTWAAWSELLPEPVTYNFEGGSRSLCELKWGPYEPRVHRSEEMGRYRLRPDECTVLTHGPTWRVARAEALVAAFEKMAAQEPSGYLAKLDARSVRVHLPGCPQFANKDETSCSCGADIHNEVALKENRITRRRA